MKNLSRNAPISFVVGAAGFIGSHLVDKLLEKNIQVIGVDDFSTGSKINLEQAVKNKNFHLIHQSASDDISIELPRLDYAFFLLPANLYSAIYQKSLNNFLEQVKRMPKTKALFLSTIELYDTNTSEFANLRNGEVVFAKFMKEHSINGRVVRLAAVYGPRMHFDLEDPIARLIKAATQDLLQKENTSLEFTTRAIYIDDAIDLLMKATLHGATAEKIYDGALLHPVKVVEIKQVLLDPMWHEMQKFAPTPLPPWPTPNLLKTQKELSWREVTSVVEGLKQTVVYFQQHPKTPKADSPNLEAKLFKKEEQAVKPETAVAKVVNADLENGVKKFLKWKQKVKVWGGGVIILYALVVPVIVTIIFLSLAVWNFDRSVTSYNESNIKEATAWAVESSQQIGLVKHEVFFWQSLLGLIQIPQLHQASRIVTTVDQAIAGYSQGIAAESSLQNIGRLMTGEERGDLANVLQQVGVDLDSADREIAQASSVLSEQNFLSQFPSHIAEAGTKLNNLLKIYQTKLQSQKALVAILPELLALDGQRQYLILLQNNRLITPGGGQVIAYGVVIFEKGRLKDVKSYPVESFDRLVDVSVDVNKEIAQDFNQSSWSLRYIAQEPDFPATARSLQMFYQRAHPQENISGVLAINTDLLVSLLEHSPAISVEDQQVSAATIYTQLANNPGSAEVILKEQLNRLFFLSDKNSATSWQIIKNGLEKKQLVFYTQNSTLFSYFANMGWAGIMPRQATEVVGERDQFLSIAETKISSQNLNPLSKKIQLESNINQEGIVTHKLSLTYTKQDSVTDIRIKTYLPAGSKMQRVVWDGVDVTAQTSSFSDFGRSGYMIVGALSRSNDATVEFNYQDFRPVNLEDKQLVYSLNVVKPLGGGDDPFQFRLNYPLNLTAVDQDLKNPGQIQFDTDLSQDHLFEILLQQ